jgi:hypothetical protein
MGDERGTGAGKGRSLRLADVSRNALSLSGASETCAPETASILATRLFGCYRASEANDPEMFMIAAAAMLAQYPQPVAEKVCDPIRGLASKSKFLPAIAEIREACELEMTWLDAVERREREREQTRRVLDGHKAPVGSPEHRRAVGAFAELRAELGKPQAGDPVNWRTMTPAQAEANLAELSERYAAGPPQIGPALARQNAERRAAEASDMEAYGSERGFAGRGLP